MKLNFVPPLFLLGLTKANSPVNELSVSSAASKLVSSISNWNAESDNIQGIEVEIASFNTAVSVLAENAALSFDIDTEGTAIVTFVNTITDVLSALTAKATIFASVDAISVIEIDLISLSSPVDTILNYFVSVTNDDSELYSVFESAHIKISEQFASANSAFGAPPVTFSLCPTCNSSAATSSEQTAFSKATALSSSGATLSSQAVFSAATSSKSVSTFGASQSSVLLPPSGPSTSSRAAFSSEINLSSKAAKSSVAPPNSGAASSSGVVSPPGTAVPSSRAAQSSGGGSKSSPSSNAVSASETSLASSSTTGHASGKVFASSSGTQPRGSSGTSSGSSAPTESSSAKQGGTETISGTETFTTSDCSCSESLSGSEVGTVYRGPQSQSAKETGVTNSAKQGNTETISATETLTTSDCSCLEYISGSVTVTVYKSPESPSATGTGVSNSGSPGEVNNESQIVTKSAYDTSCTDSSKGGAQPTGKNDHGNEGSNVANYQSLSPSKTSNNGIGGGSGIAVVSTSTQTGNMPVESSVSVVNAASKSLATFTTVVLALSVLLL